jgi:hypothetical protein
MIVNSNKLFSEVKAGRERTPLIDRSNDTVILDIANMDDAGLIQQRFRFEYAPDVKPDRKERSKKRKDVLVVQIRLL